VQDVGSKASEFGYLSGLYSMELIVGDAVLSNSFSWTVADVVLKFSESVHVPSPSKDQYLFAPKPEIKVCSFKFSIYLYFKTNDIIQDINFVCTLHIDITPTFFILYLFAYFVILYRMVSLCNAERGMYV
jgi:hypothetical protein